MNKYSELIVVRPKKEIDLESFYKEGFSFSRVPVLFYNEIAKGLNEIEWLSTPYSDHFRRIPKKKRLVSKESGISRTDAEKIQSNESNAYMPELIINTLKEMISDKSIMGSILNAYKAELVFADAWDGVEPGWHWDGPSSPEIIGLIYFNNDVTPDYGGSIQLGIREIPCNDLWIKTIKDPEVVAEISPKSRNLLWINNTNPRFVHNPVPLRCKKSERITLSFGIKLTSIM